MRRLLLVVTLAGGTVAAIWLGVPADSPNRVATCPVEVSDEGLALAAQQGWALKRHDRLRFPVRRAALADGGLAFDLPPEMSDLRGLLKVEDWDDCTIDPCAAHPNVCDRWDSAFPARFPGANVRKCVRQRAALGLPCLRRSEDGGSFDFGDENVFLRSEAVDPATCEPVECRVWAGENPLEVL